MLHSRPTVVGRPERAPAAALTAQALPRAQGEAAGAGAGTRSRLLARTAARAARRRPGTIRHASRAQLRPTLGPQHRPGRTNGRRRRSPPLLLPPAGHIAKPATAGLLPALQAAGARLMPLGEGALCLACGSECADVRAHAELNRKLPCPGAPRGVCFALLSYCMACPEELEPPHLMPVPLCVVYPPRSHSKPTAARPARAAGPALRRAVVHRLRRLRFRPLLRPGAAGGCRAGRGWRAWEWLAAGGWWLQLYCGLWGAEGRRVGCR